VKNKKAKTFQSKKAKSLKEAPIVWKTGLWHQQRSKRVTQVKKPIMRTCINTAR